MPRSKQRKQHHQHHPHPTGTIGKKEKNRSSVGVATGFCTLIGLGIAYFAAGTPTWWLAVGAIVGGIAGYFFGKQLDKSFSKNSSPKP